LPLLASSGSASWVDNFNQLFNRKSLSDVVIEVQQEKFEVHKAILAAHSPVFLTMFHSDLTEKQTNTLKIEGIEPAVFKEVLRFIYTDQVEKLDELAVELMAVADRYMLELLKSKCEAHLAGKITVENCVDLLMLADLHSAVGLKTFVLDFFRLRASEVAQTASWQQLMQSANPLLFRDISVALIPKVCGVTAQPSTALQQ
jgi:speckle-type POZ protein